MWAKARWAAPAGDLEGPYRLGEERLGPVGAVREGVRDAGEGRDLEAPLLIGPAEAPGGCAVDEGAVAEPYDLGGGFPAHHRVEAADGDEGPLGVVGSGEARGEFGEAAGAVRAVRLCGLEPLVHEVRGLEPPSAGAGRRPGVFDGGGPRGLLELVVVGEGLGEPEGRVDAQVVVEAGQVERGAQVADGGGGRGEQGGAAEFVQDPGVRVGAGRLDQGPLQTAAGRVGGSDGEVLDGGGPQPAHDVLVVVGVHFEEVAGDGGRSVARLGERPGRASVQGGPHAGGHGAVHGGRDERVRELQRRNGHEGEAVPAGRRRRHDPGGPEAFGVLGDLLRVHSGEGREEVGRAVRAEDRRRPGELGRAAAEFLQAGDESAAAAAGAEVAEETGGACDGFEHPVACLGEQLDRLVRVAGGHRPQFAAERFVRVPAEDVPGECGGGPGGEGVQAQGEDGAAREGGERRGRAVALRLAHEGAVGEDDEGGQPAVVPGPGEGVEPGQGFGVGPVDVVHEQHRGPVPQPVREAVQEPGEAEQHALRVGGRVRGRRGDAQRRGQEVEVVAEELPHLVGVEAVQGGLEQLAGEVEGDGGEGLAAAGGQDGAPVPGGAVDLGEERGLPYARVAPVDEYAAAPGAAGPGSGDEFVDGVGGRGELRVAFEQTAPLRVGDVRRERRCGRRLFGIRRHR